jgi:hypothetical protein
MKSKMAATAGLNLTLDPIGKMIQNASSLKPLVQFNQTAQELSKQKLGKGYSNDHSFTVWVQSVH